MNIITVPIFQNFSERAYENLLDTMKHCGWNRNSKTAQKVTEKLPVIPNHLQTRFQGYQCIGIFGDGYGVYHQNN